MKIWHISSIITALVVVVMFATASSSAMISAVLFIFAYPACLVWCGWTLKVRSLQRSKDVEQRVLNRIRQEGAAGV